MRFILIIQILSCIAVATYMFTVGHGEDKIVGAGFSIVSILLIIALAIYPSINAHGH